MKLGIPKEVYPGEFRVAATPDTAERLQKLGYEILVEKGAGSDASYLDSAYAEAGAKLVNSAEALWKEADWILKVRAPQTDPRNNKDECEYLNSEKGLVCFAWPDKDPDLLEKLRATNAAVIAIDKVPRITRAQKMDALSSMANVAGYRAVVEASQHFGRFFTGQITAAGKIPPAKVMIIGAGVAGLSAIGTARGMGAIVRAFDTRPAVKEQVESMGAEFLELKFEEDGTGEGGYAKVMSKEFIDAEMALFARQALEVDIIITTALVPGTKAPELITAGMVESMKEGSVVVDLAAEQGGNCALTVPGKVVKEAGVSIIGYTDLPSRMANQSSQLYGTNLYHLFDELGGAENFHLDMDNEVLRGATCCHRGETMWPPPKSVAPPPASGQAPKKEELKEEPKESEAKKSGAFTSWILPIAAVILALGLGSQMPASFQEHFTVFVLSCFVGFMVIWNVTHALHTPLMSVTNAISGIIVVGGMLQLGGGAEASQTVKILGAIAILIATINIVGGFCVTERMLRMFRR